MTLRRFLLVCLLGGGLGGLALTGCGLPPVGTVPVDNAQLAPFEAPDESELADGEDDSDDWGLDDVGEPEPEPEPEPAPEPTAEAAPAEAPAAEAAPAKPAKAGKKAKKSKKKSAAQ